MGRRNNSLRDNSYDGVMLAVTVILIMIGLVMVFSTSAIMAYEKYSNMYFFVLKQIFWAIIGCVSFSVGLKINYKIWAKISRVAIFIILFMLIGVLIPAIGHQVSGARRWLRIGGIGIQPAELAKIVVVIYMASVMDRKYTKIQNSYKNLIGPIGLVALMIGLIYAQPDFGTAFLIFILTCIILFFGGVKIKHMALVGLSAVPFIAYAILAYDYRRRRLFSFLKPFENLYGSGYQLANSLIALGDGGLTGTGLGNGYQKLFYIPEVHTDFVYAIIGQELGLLGTLLILILFGIFTWRGGKIALNNEDFLGKLMAGGLTVMITLQAVINIGVVTGCLPTKGISLPFISFGGSSLVFNMLAVGIILNISKYAKY
ncbi:MAG: putative lipid II flippase FtsW [Elusimicrobiota bacterium]